MGKVLLLSIGINKYYYFPDELQLRYCVNDAEIIYKKYSQINCEYSELLQDENATRANILKKLQDIQTISRDEDYFVFNFAGHGCTSASENINSTNSFICPYDFENGYFHTGICLHDINKAISSIKAGSKFIIFDACHSGGALRRDFSSLNLRGISVDSLVDLLGENKGTCIITSCDSEETAIEDGSIEHGIFTYNLIECLEQIGSFDSSPLIPYNDVYSIILEKVRKATENCQNPQIKSSNPEFKILSLPLPTVGAKKEIEIDTTLVPTPEISKASEYYALGDLEEFEKITIRLIQEDRFVEIDKLVKNQIKTIYTKLSNSDLPFNAEISDAIPYYESCREYLKPLLILTRYIIEYYDSRYIKNNLKFILQLNELTKYKSGKAAIIDIPVTILSEYLLHLITLAYKEKNVSILKELIICSITDDLGLNSRIIYDTRIWHPELFKRSVETYIKYIFPENNRKDFFLVDDQKYFNEINFLLDCYSVKPDTKNTCYPAYLTLGSSDAPEQVVSRLLSKTEYEDPELIEFVKELFSLRICHEIT